MGMNKAEKEIISNIDEYGCHITTVIDPEKIDPNFTYSTGITKTYGAPEIIILGLSSKLGAWIINEYARNIKSGEIFEVDKFYSGFIDGFDITIKSVSKKHREEFMLSSCWLNDGSEFKAIQVIYPTTAGVWPWEPEASESFLKAQPCLAKETIW